MEILYSGKRRHKISLTVPEINHILSLAEVRDREGWYYSPKAAFEKRHARIIEKLEKALEE
jgi:hypothetical protein